jgi:hypothetical protein
MRCYEGCGWPQFWPQFFNRGFRTTGNDVFIGYMQVMLLYNDKIKAGEAWLEWAENNRDKIFD